MRRLTTAPRFSKQSEELLRAYCEAYFFLNMKKEDGTNEADNLVRAVENLQGRKGAAVEAKRAEFEARLYLPDFPEEYTFAWSSFFDLNNCRGSNGFGVNPISFSEIEAYTRLTGKVLLPYEINAINIIDSCFLKAQNDLHKSAQKAKKDGTNSAQAPPAKKGR